MKKTESKKSCDTVALMSSGVASKLSITCTEKMLVHTSSWVLSLTKFSTPVACLSSVLAVCSQPEPMISFHMIHAN
jgi:hypothetical protein